MGASRSQRARELLASAVDVLYDGEKIAIIGRSALAGFAAREAGYRRRMVTWMISIIEQYAHFGITRPVELAEDPTSW